jgi:alpha-N-arabinofuranosidase
MPSYPAWEAEVLEQCYDSIDHISLHMYFRNDEKETLNYLAKTAIMERYIETVGGVIDYVQAKKRSTKKVTICFDEWNVWYHTRDSDRERMDAWDWPEQPRLLEDIYNFEDVLQVGSILNTLIRQSHRVRIACIAQLVNVIAPIMTEPGGPAWRQTIFYPYYFASRFGRGTALRLVVDSPTYKAKTSPATPYLDVSAVHDPSQKRVTLFMVNRHLTEAMEVTTELGGFQTTGIDDQALISGHDINDTNTVDAQNRVAPTARVDAVLRDGLLTVALPPLSYAMVSLGVQ